MTTLMRLSTGILTDRAGAVQQMEVLHRTDEVGYRFRFNANGWNFTYYSILLTLLLKYVIYLYKTPIPSGSGNKA